MWPLRILNFLISVFVSTHHEYLGCLFLQTICQTLRSVCSENGEAILSSNRMFIKIILMGSQWSIGLYITRNMCTILYLCLGQGQLDVGRVNRMWIWCDNRVYLDTVVCMLRQSHPSLLLCVTLLQSHQSRINQYPYHNHHITYQVLLRGKQRPGLNQFINCLLSQASA